MADIDRIARQYATAAEESQYLSGDQVEPERDLLAAVRDELTPEDTVWVLGANGGPYAMLAAAVVGGERVAVVDERSDRRREVDELLRDAGHDGVSVAAPDAREAIPASPTVVIVDEHAVESPAVTTALAGRLPGVRYLLMTTDDEAAADRLRQGGFETAQVLDEDSSARWETAVEGRRDPSTTVNPVVSRLFDGPLADEVPEEDTDEETEADDEPDGPLTLLVEGVRLVLAVVIVLVLATVYGLLGSLFVLLVTTVLWPVWLLPGPEAWLTRNDLLLYGIGFAGGFCYFFLSAGLRGR